MNPIDSYIHVRTNEHSVLRALLTIIGVEVKPARLVVDTGCGQAPYLDLLADIIKPDGKIIAIDHRKNALRTVRIKAKRFGIENMEIRKANIERLGSLIDPASVDLLLSASMLQFTDLARTTAAFALIVRPNGWLVFSVPMGVGGIMEENPKGFYGMFQEELREALIHQVLCEISTYATELVLRRLPDRKFDTFFNAVESVGFEITRHYLVPQMIPASKLAAHFSAVWRADKLLPHVPHETAKRCIANALKKTIGKLSVPPDRMFCRDFHYAAARRRERAKVCAK